MRLFLVFCGLFFNNCSSQGNSFDFKLESNCCVLNYNEKKQISALDFFNIRMNQAKDYKVSGKKLEIFKDDTDFLFCAKFEKIDGNNFFAESVFVIPKGELLKIFPNYYVEGYQLRAMIYDFLLKNSENYSVNGFKNRFIYELVGNEFNVHYSQYKGKKIVNKYFFVISENLQITESKNILNLTTK